MVFTTFLFNLGDVVRVVVLVWYFFDCFDFSGGGGARAAVATVANTVAARIVSNIGGIWAA